MRYAQYRADRSAYPKTLAALSPKYLAEVPKDIFNNCAALHYKREGSGYLLYSVGYNGKDDGGKSMWEGEGDDCDDLRVRMPAK